MAGAGDPLWRTAEEALQFGEEAAAEREHEERVAAFIKGAISKGYTIHTMRQLMADAKDEVDIETLEGFLYYPLSGNIGRWGDYTPVKGTLEIYNGHPYFSVPDRDGRDTRLMRFYYKKVGPSKANEIRSPELAPKPAVAKGGKRRKHTHKKPKSKRKTHRRRR